MYLISYPLRKNVYAGASAVGADWQFLDKKSLASNIEMYSLRWTNTHTDLGKHILCGQTLCCSGWQQMPSAPLGIVGLFLHGRHSDLLKRKHRGETNPISNGSISHISCEPRQKQEPWCAELNIKIRLTCVRLQRFQGSEFQRRFLSWDETQCFPFRATSRLAAKTLAARSLKQAPGGSL